MMGLKTKYSGSFAKRIFKSFYHLALWTGSIAISLSVVEAASRIEATLDRPVISLDGRAFLRIEVSSDQQSDIDQPQFSSSNLQIDPRGSSTQMRSVFVNGTFSTEFKTVFEFEITPKAVGTFSISNIVAKVDGQEVRAPNLSLQILPSNQAVPQNAQQVIPSKGTDFFVRAEVSKESVYLGERVFVTYYLYGRNGLTGVSGDKFPVFEGFLKEELSLPIVTGELRPQEVTLQGKRYARFLLAQYSATPLKAGKLRIDPLAVKVSYTAGAGAIQDEDDLFSSLFRAAIPRTERLTAESKTIEVLQPPTAQRPADYSGLVGNFSVLWSLNNSSVNTGQPFTLTYKIEGTGSLSGFKVPQLQLPEGLEVIDSKTKGSSSATGTDVKVFEFTLMANKPGNFVVPGLSVSAFSPDSKTYQTLTVEDLSLQAMGQAVDNPTSLPSHASTGAVTTQKSPPESKRLAISDLSDRGITWTGVLFGIAGLAAMGMLVWLYLLLRKINQRSEHFSEALSKDELDKTRVFLEGMTTELNLMDEHDLSLPQLQKIAVSGSDRFEQALERALKGPISGLNASQLADLLRDRFKISQTNLNQMQKMLDFRDWLKYSNQTGRSQLTEIRQSLRVLFDTYVSVLSELFEKSQKKSD